MTLKTLRVVSIVVLVVVLICSCVVGLITAELVNDFAGGAIAGIGMAVAVLGLLFLDDFLSRQKKD